MARYRLTKEYADSLATRGPVTFGDDMPGYWFPGEDNAVGDENLNADELVIEDAIKKGGAFHGIIERVGKSSAPTAAERRKLQLDAEPASADPTEAQEEVREQEERASDGPDKGAK